VLRLIGRSLTWTALCLVGVLGLGCGSDENSNPQGSGGIGGTDQGPPTGSAGGGAGGMLGNAGAMGVAGGAGAGSGGATASARVQFVLREVH